MEAVYTLVFSLVAIFNSIGYSSQSGSFSGIASTSDELHIPIRAIDKPRWYQEWILPENAHVKVFAEHIKRLVHLEVNQEYMVLKSGGSRHYEVFAFRIFGAPYAIYDHNNVRAAIMSNGMTRPLSSDDEKILDATHSMFKLPAEGLPLVPNRALYGPPSRIPRSLRGIYYEVWLLEFHFKLQVIQNLPQKCQRFYVLPADQKYNVLRNPAGEVFAIRMLDQVHVLYDLDDSQSAFNMSTGKPRALLEDEKQFFDARADTIKLIGTAEEIRGSVRR